MKIKKQSKQVNLSKLTEQTTKKGVRATFFSAIPWKHDTGLPALVVVLCSKGSKCSDTNRMPCKRSWIAFQVVWVWFLPFHPQPLNWEQVCFVLCIATVRWWILMFLTTANLVSELHRNYLFKFKFCLQFDQRGTWWRCFANGLQTCSV